MREIAPFNYDSNDAMPRFVEDLCEPLFDVIRAFKPPQQRQVLGFYWDHALDMKNDEPEEYPQSVLELALDSFIWNMAVNQPSEGAPPHNSLLMFMQVASPAWKLHNKKTFTPAEEVVE